MNNGASSGYFGFVPVVMFLALYCYMGYSLQVLSRKTNTPDAWMSWVPILNIFQIIRIAGKPLWWFILFLIPLVNIVMAIIVWMSVAERVGKPSWLGILMIVPVVNLVIPGYLAFSDSTPGPMPMSTPPPAAPGMTM